MDVDFLVFTYVGLAAAIVHLLLPRVHRVGPAAAIALGVVGAWTGALLAGVFVRGGWAYFSALHLAGSIVGAVGAIAMLEALTTAYLRDEARGLP